MSYVIETAAGQAADELPADEADDEEPEEDVEEVDDEDASEDDDEDDEEPSLFTDVGLDVPLVLLDEEPRLSFR